MQDRFRFRLYDKEKGLMLYEDSEILRTEKVYEYEELWWANVAFPIKAISRFFDYNSEERFVLQQCTGLKDKNGKLIYEGDIVKLSGNDNPYMNNLIGVVKYSQEYAIFFINIPNNIAWYEFCEVNKKELKIIGNTYQNPKLLKEK